LPQSVLDLFILSVLDRGLETPYDLNRQGGLSLGSTVPALRRLETAGLVRKKAAVGSSKRPRHWFQLSAAGRKLARGGWAVHVEEWLDSLPLAPASKTKIKSVFSVLFSHAIRHEWVSLNPISKVRTSSKRLREKDVLTPMEFQALLAEPSVREVAMVLLIGSTGVAGPN
jgi:DNA-binding PadR family transcriptional regulator